MPYWGGPRHQRAPQQQDLNGFDIRHGADRMSTLEHTRECLLRALLDIYVTNQVSSAPQDEASTEASPLTTGDAAVICSKAMATQTKDKVSFIVVRCKQ